MIREPNLYTFTSIKNFNQTFQGLGRAGTLGIEKAVKVLDTLGSSMTNLNRNSGFAAGVTVKGNEVSILAFEVANTIVKGYSLMESVSDSKVQQLKDIVLSSEGVQYLVSKDMDELLKMVTADKRLVLENCINLCCCMCPLPFTCLLYIVNCFLPEFYSLSALL